MICEWCSKAFVAKRKDARTCSRMCRQSAYRIRKRTGAPRLDGSATGRPMRFALADPPYPGKAWKYKDQPSFAGEVDHFALLSALEGRRISGAIQGWALATLCSLRVLRRLMSHLPEHAELHPWIKPIGVSSKTYGAHQTCELLLVVPGRRLRPGFRNGLVAQPARGGGTLVGRKPIAWCAWAFRHLGALPGDELEDLFPGSGAVSRAWAEVSRTAVVSAPIDMSSAAGAQLQLLVG